MVLTTSLESSLESADRRQPPCCSV